MSEHATFFRETVERILSDTLTQADIEASAERRLPGACLAALSENGVPLILVPEENGGIGGDLVDACEIMRAAGQAAMPGPLLETMLGNRILAMGGLALGDGPLALVFADNGVALFDVPWGGLASQVIVLEDRGGKAVAHRIDPSQMSIDPALDAASEPRDTLRGTIGAESFDTGCDINELHRSASIMRASQILGAVEWTLKRSIEYAGEREQFGRPIGKFQAVQQMLAELSGHVLAAGGIVEAAAANPNRTLVAAARARLGDASDAAIAIGHQVHGAIGFSIEYALNHRTRRLMSWRDDFGSVAHWRRALASRFTGNSREDFWPAISDAGLDEAA